MCGVAGFIDRRAGGNAGRLRAQGRAMADALAHRGPDDGGTWVDPAEGVALGHRRLAVVDLSPAGAQPMTAADARYVISYNGEVYNHAELRANLVRAGHHDFAGRSDTEVVLAAIAAWGLETAVSRLVGMFAIALWDRARRELHLVRDRLGVKPLYYGTFGPLTVFASALAGLEAHPGWPRRVCPRALAAYLAYGYVPAPRSIYRQVAKVEPGQIVTVDRDGRASARRYWDLRQLVPAWRADPLEGPETEILDGLERVLGAAVGTRLAADVPLGAFLSGGIDSTLVTALMQERSAEPIRTFSIGFGEIGFDEAGHARRVAEALGTRHTELYLDPERARDAIPDLPRWFDEPFADASQVPTLLLAKLARAHVTVALSGDGGDELFAGYNRYLALHRYWARSRRLPAPWRRWIARRLTGVAPASWDRLFRLFPARRRPPQAGDKVHKLAGLLSADTPERYYAGAVACWPRPETALAPEWRRSETALAPPEGAGLPDALDRLMLCDTRTYLPDDVLAKVDRATMAYGLEARVPMLDHRVVEYAWRMPAGLRMRDGAGKWPLRQLLYRRLPAAMVDRPKMGFGLPIDRWLRGPLRPWAEDLLDPGRLRADGIFEPEAVRATWRAHLDGRVNRQAQLWALLMFQAWYRRPR